MRVGCVWWVVAAASVAASVMTPGEAKTVPVSSTVCGQDCIDTRGASFVAPEVIWIVLGSMVGTLILTTRRLEMRVLLVAWTLNLIIFKYVENFALWNTMVAADLLVYGITWNYRKTRGAA